MSSFTPNTIGPDAIRLQHRIREASREEQEVFSKTISDLGPSDVLMYLQCLEERYGIVMDTQFQMASFSKFFDWMLDTFAIPKEGNFAAEALSATMNLEIKRTLEIFQRMNQLDVLGDASLSTRISNVLGFLYYANHALHTLQKAHQIAKDAGNLVPVDTKNDKPIAGLTLFRIIAPDETNDFQKLILHLLNTARIKGYRKYNGDVYIQRFNDANQYTHSWERLFSIKDFIFENASKELTFDIWKYLTQNRGNASAAAEYLANCKDPEFPDLIKDRHVFSFANGVYITKHWDGERFLDIFHPYSSDRKLPHHLVACKYFPLTFQNYDDVKDWYDIPTPNLQSIFEFQGWPESVCRWMYVFVGRLLYEVGEMDCWQVIPFLKGTAGSGKSTIALKVCGNLFEKADIGILSNNIERKFGISAFCDKYLFVAPEIKGDLQMEQAEFQSIVSGESVQVNVKFAKAHSVEWSVPGILAGNELPNWGDNSGSFSRRAIIFEFVKQVKNGDMELGRKLDAEMAAIIKKCNKAYLEATCRYARDNVWNHLPDYFRATRSEVEEATNSVEHYLNSGKLVFGKDLYCRYDDFVSLYKLHAREFNFPSKKIDKDLWKTPFSKRNLRSIREERNGLFTYWVDGADFAERRGFGDL